MTLAQGRRYDAGMLTRRHFITTSTAAFVGTAFWDIPLVGQQQQPPATPLMKDLRRNTGIFTMRGGTIGWLINPAGVVIVDSQFPPEATACVEELTKKSKRTEFSTLINTHHHGDHTGGNEVFRPKVKEIIGHANVPKYMQGAYEQRKAQNPPPPAPVVPDRTLTDSLTLEHGDERVRIKHYGPAHTGGDVVIYFERANVAHMGDLMFNRLHPVIDRANGASIANWTKVLNAVAAELPADTMYIFGHAGQKFEVTGTREDLAYHGKYLTALLDYAREQVKAGKTLEQLIAQKDLIKGFEDYGPLIQRTLTPAFDEASAK